MEAEGEGQRQTVTVGFQSGSGRLEDFGFGPGENLGSVGPEGFLPEAGDAGDRFAAEPFHPAEVVAGFHGT